MSTREASVGTVDLLINIDVDDLAKATLFYEQAAGLSVGRTFGNLGAEMLGAASPIYLLLKSGGTKTSLFGDDLRRYDRHWTPVHLDFVVADIEAALGRALAVGATHEGEIEIHSWGKIAHLADPFGHGICFIQFLGTGYDEIADH
jgi:predicted enzyme related to lactoylglutathione lyase